MRKAYIVEAVRLPVGKFGGVLKDVIAQDLGAEVMKACISRGGINPAQIDEVIVGNVMQYDPKGNPAREAALKAGIPVEIPAFTVNKNCGSSLKAISLAHCFIQAGQGDVYLVAGMENMSGCPYLLKNARFGYRMGNGVLIDSLTDGLEGMGMTAERLAEMYSISRAEQDEFAMESQRKALEAQRNGVFERQIVPIEVRQGRVTVSFDKDEGLKETALDSLSKLRPAFKSDGTVTAGNASTINDGAAALLIVGEERIEQLGLTPMVEIVSCASTGCSPEIMGIGPVEASKKALSKAGLRLEDIDVFELNEAFAAQAIAVIRELGIDQNKVNPHGSGISLGHPVGATGAILLTKLAHDLVDRGKHYGLATMCIGGGQGIAIVLKNCSKVFQTH